MDLAERARIQRIEREVQWLYQHLGLARPTAAPVDPRVPPEVLELARSGRTLLAIKAYCEATGADLATGRAFVESLPRI
jgi:hypothetical protein